MITDGWTDRQNKNKMLSMTNASEGIKNYRTSL